MGGEINSQALSWRLIDIILSVVPLLIIITAVLAALSDGKIVLNHPGTGKIIDVTSIVSSSRSPTTVLPFVVREVLIA